MLLLALLTLVLSCAKQDHKQNILNTTIEHISLHHVPFMKMHYHNDSIVLNNNGKVILLHPKMNQSLFTSISPRLEQIRSNDGYFTENQLALNPKKITQNGVKIRSYHFSDNKRANDILYEQKAHAIVIFAPFIYNDNMTEAVLFVNYVCGGLCGGIYKYTLTKKDVNWEVSDT